VFSDDPERGYVAIVGRNENGVIWILCEGKLPLGLWTWDGDWIQYGVGGLFGLQGAEVAVAGARAAGKQGAGLVVGSGKFAYKLTVGALVDIGQGAAYRVGVYEAEELIPQSYIGQLKFDAPTAGEAYQEMGVGLRGHTYAIDFPVQQGGRRVSPLICLYRPQLLARAQHHRPAQGPGQAPPPGEGSLTRALLFQLKEKTLRAVLS